MHWSGKCLPDAKGAAVMAISPILAKRVAGRWTQVGIISYGALAPQRREELGLTVKPPVYVNVRHCDTWSRAVISSGN